MKDQELEVKYLVLDLAAVQARLEALGAQLEQPRCDETNLRFDTLNGALTRGGQTLRLRQDTKARLTYKGPSSSQGGARLRTEIEFVVSDFRSAQAFLEALGYQVAMIYEKRRTTYDLDGMHVALDEMPYGNFVEIEGTDPQEIQAASRQLGLRWEASVAESYSMLFDRVKRVRGLDCRDLSFENFRDLQISPQDLNAVPADEGGSGG
jgi:adenylate cyclase, class 2